MQSKRPLVNDTNIVPLTIIVGVLGLSFYVARIRNSNNTLMGVAEVATALTKIVLAPG